MFHKNEITTYEQQLKIDKIENNLMEYQLKSNKELLVNLALHLKYYIEYINPLKDELKAAIELPEDEQKNKIKNIYISMQNNIKILNNTENLNKQINNIYKDFLDKLDKKYPYYNFKNNKGYPTKDHLKAIEEHGIINEHRRSYGPVKKVVNE